MEGKELHPVVGDDDIHRFDPGEVIHIVQKRFSRAVDPSRVGERDARIFEMLDAGKELREIVTTLRLPVDIVLKLIGQWGEVGRRDMVVPPACRAELARYLGGSIKDAAELTQLVRSLDADRDRLECEKTTITNSMARIIVIIGEAAARNPDLATALPVLRDELDAELIELLDRVFKQSSVSPEPAAEPDAEPAAGP